MDFIGKCVRDEDRKLVMFQDFDEAIAAANDIEECGGITMKQKGKFVIYSLRKGTKCVANPEGTKSGMASWTKMTSPKKAQKASPKKKKVVEEDAVVEEEEEEVAKKKTQKKTFKPKEPEPEEEEDDEVEVEEVLIDGTKYFKDAEDVLWDPDSQEEVGKYVDGELVEN